MFWQNAMIHKWKIWTDISFPLETLSGLSYVLESLIGESGRLYQTADLLSVYPYLDNFDTSRNILYVSGTFCPMFCQHCPSWFYYPITSRFKKRCLMFCYPSETLSWKLSQATYFIDFSLCKWTLSIYFFYSVGWSNFIGFGQVHAGCSGWLRRLCDSLQKLHHRCC